ncbi:UBXN1 protein, partial [Atractosteus spatula]|nr:UBXN1 protein [Atractosteus spatula]
MAEYTTLESLLEMGFDRNRAEKAVAHTGNQGIERAMDWLMEHENDPDVDEPYVPPAGNVLGSEGAEQGTPADASTGAVPLVASGSPRAGGTPRRSAGVHLLFLPSPVSSSLLQQSQSPAHRSCRKTRASDL